VSRAVSDRCRAWIKAEENFRGFPYPDSKGITTIGYGRNLEANPLTRAEAEVLLETDLEHAVATVYRIAPWAVRLDDVRWSVLVAMAFQMGNRLRTFRQTLAEIEAGNYAGAARRMLQSKWARKDSPARAARSALLMESGRWDALPR
jgi:lysozyme